MATTQVSVPAAGSGRGPGPVRRPLLLAAVAVVAVAVPAGHLLTRPDPPVPVRVTLSMAPAETGTLVTLTLSTVRGRLPARLTAVLAATDPAGGSARLAYSDLRLDGRRISLHDQAYSLELEGLPAGGSALRLSYRVAPVGGRRVVVPPSFRGTVRQQLSVSAVGGRLGCTRAESGPAAGPVAGSPPGPRAGCRVDGGVVRPSAGPVPDDADGLLDDVRLELVTG